MVPLLPVIGSASIAIVMIRYEPSCCFDIDSAVFSGIRLLSALYDSMLILSGKYRSNWKPTYSVSLLRVMFTLFVSPAVILKSSIVITSAANMLFVIAKRQIASVMMSFFIVR